MSKMLALAEAAGLKLKRLGKEFSGLCPFHAEKTPSFSIDHRKDVFHCFGCGASGGYVEFAKELGLNLDDVLGPLHDNQPWIAGKQAEPRIHRQLMPWDEHRCWRSYSYKDENGKRQTFSEPTCEMPAHVTHGIRIPRYPWFGRRCDVCGSCQYVATDVRGVEICAPCWADRRIDIDILWGQITGHYPEEI